MAVLVVVTTTVAAWFIQTRIMAAWKVAELGQIARTTLARAEYAADYAVIAGSEIVSAGGNICTRGQRELLRRLVFQRSIVKDIRLLGPEGRILCSAFPEVLFDPTNAVEPLPAVSARNTDFSFQRIRLAGTSMLGVVWRASSTRSVMTIVKVDAQLFDALPTQVRDDARLVLSVGSADEVSRFDTLTLPPEEAVRVVAASERYPLEVSLAVNPAHLSTWLRESEQPAIGVGLVLGLLAAAFMLRELRRPENPIEVLRKAIDQGEIRPHYQPIVSLATGAIIGCELLARWTKRDGTLVSPGSFIPLAEQSGLIVPMRRALMRRALTELRPILHGNARFKVAVNISAGDFIARRFAEDIRSIARDAEVAPSQIVIEITERQGFADMTEAAAAVKRVRALGFKVALDDLGTGSNGLSQLQDLGVDILKIDKKFVDLVGIDEAATAIVRMIVNLSETLGMTTVAEGIEREAQRAALAACGVTQAQGYLFSAPKPIDSFIAAFGHADETSLRVAGSRAPLAA